MRDIKLLGLALVGVLAGSIHCNSEEAPRPKLRVGMLHWIGYAGLNVAETKGFWKDEGVDVELTNNISNQELNSDLVNGRIDVALDMMGSWVGLHVAGSKLKVLGETEWSYGGDQIIKKKTLDTTKLPGQQVAVYLDQPSITFFLGKYLEANNADLASIRLVEIETAAMAAAFAAGTYQLTVNYEPASSEQLTATAQGELAATSKSPGLQGSIPDGFVARGDILKDVSRDTLKRFIKGWVKAVKWVYADADAQVVDEAHWSEYADILRKQTFVGDRTDDNAFTDAELRGFVSNVKVHSANYQLCVNKGKTGIQVKDSTIPNPQHLADYFDELKPFLERTGKLKDVKDPTLANFEVDGTDGTGIFDASILIEALEETGAKCTL